MTLPVAHSPHDIKRLVAEDLNSWESHVEAFIQARQVEDVALWAQGAVADSLVTAYGKTSVGKFAYAVGKDARRVWELAQMYRCFPDGPVDPQLTPTHHVIAMRDSDPVAFAQEAADNGWSTPQMRRELQEREEDGRAEVVEEEECPYCNGRGRRVKV